MGARLKQYLVSQMHITSVNLVRDEAFSKKIKNDVSCQTIAGTREQDIIERTQSSLTSLTN